MKVLEKQRTIKKPVSIGGIGLHSGEEVRLQFLPASEGEGIVFIRRDIKGSPRIRAHHRNIIDTRLATTISENGTVISTVEHLLAAFAGMGIDNILVELDGPEVPIFDGSARAFVEAFSDAGIREQKELRPTISLKRELRLDLGDGRWADILPSKELEIEASFEWRHPILSDQKFSYKHIEGAFSEIETARTFCLLKDVENMKRMGLIRGGSLDNAVVLDEERVLNPDGLRFENEFARHKVLDALGDFKLAGIGIQAKFRIHKSGHEFHKMVMGKLFEDTSLLTVSTGVDADRMAKDLAAVFARTRVAAS